MKSYRKRLVAVVLLILVILLAWLFWPDRKLAQAKALQKELFGPNARSLSSEQRRAKFEQYRKLTQSMTFAQRESLSAESRKRRLQEMGRYFSMTPAEKTNYLDQRIRAMEQMRQKMQSKNGQKGPAGAGRPSGVGPTGQPPSKGNRTVAVRDQGRQRRLDSTSPAERAMFNQFMKDLTARRAKLGLPATGRGFGPPR